MSAYTVSRLALDAGVSVHIVRDYLLRGLLRPVACTPGGYGLFDDAALQGVVCGRGRNPTLRLWPAIFSGEIDVFPSERRNMGQEIGR